jgi:hypothetical protein
VAILTDSRDYNGFAQKIERLGLTQLLVEAVSTLDAPLYVLEEREANGTKGLRQSIDNAFGGIDGWKPVKSGGIDWTKTEPQGGTLGVEVQVSGRSDMLAVDVLHLKNKLRAGEIDAGLIIVPDDALSRYLTDRTPNFATAIKHVSENANDLPIRVQAFHHNGPGPALPKMRTNLGRDR